MIVKDAVEICTFLAGIQSFVYILDQTLPRSLRAYFNIWHVFTFC